MTDTSTGSGRLAGKVALITGGGRGQGACEARLFAAEGATVYLTDVLVEEGKAVAAEIGGTFIEHDVTDADGWVDLVNTIEAEQGRCDVLVNNAGIFLVASMAATDMDLWNRTIAINQTGVFLGMKTVAPLMAANGSGSIINLSSIAGLQSAAVAFAYGASKWAVRGMTKAAAVDLGPSGIRVNSVHPGIIMTPMVDPLVNAVTAEQLTSRIPLGRTAEPEEVADLVLFLASDESAYCNGSEFTIDGGMTA